MKNIALCQGCLRVHRLCDLVPSDNKPPGLCSICGQMTCDCPDQCIASSLSDLTGRIGLG
jgi:hypothetical protein